VGVAGQRHEAERAVECGGVIVLGVDEQTRDPDLRGGGRDPANRRNEQYSP
jgi:hypothetical protein